VAKAFCIASAVLIGLWTFPVRADDCEQTSEGRICKVHQPLVGGQLVSVDDQQQLGLVTVGGGCSGTLIQSSWVLTADHCISTNGIGGPVAKMSDIKITAAWSPLTVTPTDFVRWGTTSDKLDVALLHLGNGNFGRANSQAIYPDKVTKADTLTKFGRGIYEYATAAPLAAAKSDGKYRSANFTPDSADNTLSINLPVNDAGQIGDGGDSGGPDFISIDNYLNHGIASVQSTCIASGYVPPYNLPGVNPGWNWAWGVKSCQSAPLYTVRDQILDYVRPDLLKQMNGNPYTERVSSGMEDNTDRPGSDYTNFHIQEPKPSLCSEACFAQRDKCNAWTYVRPGVQASDAICYLKQPAPAAVASNCCISGTVVSRITAVVTASKEGSTYANRAPETSATRSESAFERIPTQKMTYTGPAVSEPGGFAGPAPTMTGTFDSDFGALVLTKTDGTYSYKNGRVTITKIYGDFMDGTWSQSESGQRCPDGAYRGTFHFQFTKTGFTGHYGYCDGQANAGPWNGTRR